MCNAKHLSEVQPDFISKSTFKWKYQNNLQILSDQKTIVGVKYDEEDSDDEEEDIDDKGKNPINITMEDITGRNKR